MSWDLYRQIRAAIEGGRPDEALDMIENWSKELEPIYEHVVVLKALGYALKGDRPGAIVILEEFSQKPHDSHWVFHNLAKLYRENGQLRKSVTASRSVHAKLGWFESEANGYIFTHDYFSSNIPNWRKWFDERIVAAPIECLEIGSWQGGSSTWLLDKIVSKRGGSLTCIDTFEGSSEHQEWIGSLPNNINSIFDNNIELTGHSALCKKVVGKSQAVMPFLKEQSYDFIYIDGAHEAKYVIQDAVFAWRLCRIGGYILFDDYPFTFANDPNQNTSHAVDFFLTVFAHEIEIVSKEWQVLIRRTR